jgi:hypothetical protein
VHSLFATIPFDGRLFGTDRLVRGDFAMTDRKKPGVAFWATVVVVSLPLLYVASYMVLVEPQGYAWPYPMTAATYRFPGNKETLQSAWWQRAFAPLAALDRRLRPERWAPNPIAH